MTMAVNMAYVPKPASGAKVLKMTRPETAVQLQLPKTKSDSLSEVLMVFRRVAFRGGHWKEKFV
jgi:hypothetical protein